MRFKRHNLVAFWALLFLAAPQQVSAGAVESSYRAARSMIDSAIETMWVNEWQAQQTAILIEASGTLYMGAERQGRTTDDPTPSDFAETWAYNPQSGWSGREYHHARHDGTREHVREIFSPAGDRWIIDMSNGRSFLDQSAEAKTARLANLRRFPPYLLQSARREPESLRAIGRYGPFEGVQASTEGDASLSLFFGRESKMLGWIEYLIDLPGFGDSTISWRLSEYRRVSGVGRVPYHYKVHINDSEHMDMQVTRVSTDTSQIDEFLKLPADAEPAEQDGVTPATPWQYARLEQIGEGVWLIRNLRPGFHMMFVEFDNYLLAVDAPSGYPLLQELPAGNVTGDLDEGALTRQALKMISSEVPDKPVKYAVLTHFHSDHAGGLLAYNAKTTKLVVSRSEAPAVEKFLSSTHTFCEMPQRSEPDFVQVRTRHVINDGNQRVEILDVGDNPHTGSMLTVWIPGQKILYVADLLTGVDDQPDKRHGRLNRHFLEWVERMHLNPEVIYTSHGQGRVTAAGLAD